MGCSGAISQALVPRSAIPPLFLRQTVSIDPSASALARIEGIPPPGETPELANYCPQPTILPLRGVETGPLHQTHAAGVPLSKPSAACQASRTPARAAERRDGRSPCPHTHARKRNPHVRSSTGLATAPASNAPCPR